MRNFGQGSDMTTQDFWGAAMSQPLSMGATFTGAVAEGVNSSPGLGTLVRSLSTPGLAAHPETVKGSSFLQFTENSPEQVKESGDELIHSEQEFRDSPYLRPEIPFETGMTKNRAKALANAYDLAQVRQYWASKRPVTGFVGQLVGTALDPVNYIPVLDEASIGYATAKMGAVAGRAAAGSADAFLNSMAAQAATSGARQKFGDDVSIDNMLVGSAFAAMAGGVFGAARGGVKVWREGKIGAKEPTPGDAQIKQDAAATELPANEPIKSQSDALQTEGNATATFATEMRAANEGGGGHVVDIGRLETYAARVRAAEVMNDAVMGMIHDGEVRLGVRSQGYFEAFNAEGKRISGSQDLPVTNLRDSFAVSAPEPRPSQLGEAYSRIDAAPKEVAEVVPDKMSSEFKAREGFDPVSNTHDLEADIAALREQGHVTAEDDAAFKQIDQAHEAATTWETVMQIAKECVLK